MDLIFGFVCLFQHLLHGFHGAFGRNFGIFGVLNPGEKSYKVKWLFLAGPTRREWGKNESPIYQAVKVEGPSFPTGRASQFILWDPSQGPFLTIWPSTSFLGKCLKTGRFLQAVRKKYLGFYWRLYAQLNRKLVRHHKDSEINQKIYQTWIHQCRFRN